MAQQTLHCARHTKNPTNIRCGRCETPICVECLVHGPVGMRCPDCARVSRVPTYDVSPVYLARGIAAGAVVALALGFALTLTPPLILALYASVGAAVATLMPFLISAYIAAIGFVVGEAVSLATNRKRGLPLKIVSGLCMVLASAVIVWGFPSPFLPQLFLMAAIAFGVWLSIRRF